MSSIVTLGFDRTENLLQPSGAAAHRKRAHQRPNSHSPSFDHRRRPETLFTAIATAFF